MLEIIGGTTAEQGYSSLSGYFLAGLIGERDKISHGELLPRVADIDEVMGNFRKDGWVRFGRPDIKVTVDLFRIGIHHRKPVGKHMTEQFRLSHAGRSSSLLLFVV
jgi:hypothetical protein